MRSSKSTSFSTAFVIAAALASPVLAQNTDRVVVKLNCANVKTTEFMIELATSSGPRSVKVVRTGELWSGTTETFRIAGSRLVSTLVPEIRAACNVAVKAVPVRSKWVARYEVPCDTLWDLRVASRKDRQEFHFRRDSAIQSCEPRSGAYEKTETPRTIGAIGMADKVIVAMRTQKSFVSVKIEKGRLRDYGGTATFAQLPKLPTTEAPVSGHTRYLKEAQAVKNPELTFIDASLGSGGGGR